MVLHIVIVLIRSVYDQTAVRIVAVLLVTVQNLGEESSEKQSTYPIEFLS